MGVGTLSSLIYFLIACPRLAVSDIFNNRTCKKIYILLDYSYIISEILKFNVPYIHIINGDAALRHIIEPRYKTAQGGFARS